MEMLLLLEKEEEMEKKEVMVLVEEMVVEMEGKMVEKMGGQRRRGLFFWLSVDVK